MLKLLPPQHTIDDEAIFIHPQDPAWDTERIKIERIKIERQALLDHARDADAKAQHPVDVYRSGVTRFSLDAVISVPPPIQVNGQATTTIRDYLAGKPTLFVLDPLCPRTYAKLASRIAADDPMWMIDATQNGLVEIRDPDIDLDRDGGGRISELVLIALGSQEPRIFQHVGVAVVSLTQAPGSALAAGKP